MSELSQEALRALLTEAVERAMEVLKPAEIDADDLARQAMEAADDPDAEREA